MIVLTKDQNIVTDEFINNVNEHLVNSVRAIISNSTDTIPDCLQEANNAMLERFLSDVKMETDNPTFNLSHLGLDMRYPQELLNNKNFLAVMSSAEYYQNGYAAAMQEGYIKDLREAGETALADRAETDMSIIVQMPDFYKEAVKDCINAFKNENPAFKDVEIPFFHPPMPDHFPNVVHNGKSIVAEYIDHQTVQATQFCLMKDPTDQSNPYFMMTYRIDKINDTANYITQDLKTKNLSEARNMFANAHTRAPHYQREEAYGSVAIGQTYKYINENNQIDELTVLSIEKPPLCMDDVIKTTKIELLRYEFADRIMDGRYVLSEPVVQT